MLVLWGLTNMTIWQFRRLPLGTKVQFDSTGDKGVMCMFSTGRRLRYVAWDDGQQTCEEDTIEILAGISALSKEEK